MSGCCNVPEQSGACVIGEPSLTTDVACPECGSEGRSVERKTVLHHVRRELLDRANEDVYRFCPDPVCPVVYYGECGTRFTVEDVRELVTAKASGDARPICYCFGFTEGDAREEIARTGTSTIPARISRLIKAGMCACEVRNPAGVCCLGQVNQTVKRLSIEHNAPALTTSDPTPEQRATGEESERDG